MRQIDSIEVEGFKSFATRQVLPFRSAPGLVFVTGQNGVDEELGANAAGKSTIFDALCWCLYGKTPRLVNGPSLECWHTSGKRVSVVVRFTDGTEVVRTRGPISHTIDGAESADPAGEVLLGLTLQAFLSGVLMGQVSRWFMDLGATERVDLLSDVLELSEIDAARDHTVAKAKAARSSVAAAETALERQEAGLDSAQEALEEAEERSAGWSESHSERRTDLSARITEAKAQAQQTDAEAQKAGRKAEKWETRLEDIREDLTVVREEHAKVRDKVAQAQAKVHAYQREVRRAQAALEALPEEGAKCPTCTGVLASAHRVKAVGVLTADLDDAVDVFEQHKQEATEAEKEKAKWQDEVKDLEAEFQEAEAEVARLREVYRRKLSAREADERHAQTLERELDGLDGTADPYQGEIAKLRKRLKKSKLAIKDAEKELRAAKEEQAELEFWASGFADLRFWKIAEALDTLQVRVSQHLIAVGLRGWSISFDVERPKADGKGVVKGFSVFVTSPSSGGPVPWDSWSGGETQRLRIAVAAGIADLVRDHWGTEGASFEVWDEPTAHLSVEGVSGLMEFLAARAEARPVYVIDHRSLDFPFDQRVVVVRGADGAEIQ